MTDGFYLIVSVVLLVLLYLVIRYIGVHLSVNLNQSIAKDTKMLPQKWTFRNFSAEFSEYTNDSVVLLFAYQDLKSMCDHPLRRFDKICVSEDEPVDIEDIDAALNNRFYQFSKVLHPGRAPKVLPFDIVTVEDYVMSLDYIFNEVISG